MKKRKAELYEILANNTVADDEPVGAKIYPVNKRVKSFAKSRSGREIVFSLDGAFIIFVVALLLIGTSFFLGYQKGASEVKASFVRDVERIDKVTEVNTLRLVDEYTPPVGSIDIPSGKYSLKLISLKRSNTNYRKLVEIKKEILNNALVASSKLHIFIFDKGKGGVYSLAIGLFDKSSDEMLITMKEYFKNYSLDGKTPAFNNYSVERVEDLGLAKIEN